LKGHVGGTQSNKDTERNKHNFACSHPWPLRLLFMPRFSHLIATTLAASARERSEPKRR
jgi:hypothetical protein